MHRKSKPLAVQAVRRGSITDAVAVGACLLCIAALIPAAVMQARQSAREQRSMQSLHQMGTAVQSYHQTWNAFPSGGRATFKMKEAQP